MFSDITKKLHLGSSSERQEAVMALLETGDTEAVTAVMQAALQDDSRYVRRAAVDAFAKLGYRVSDRDVPQMAASGRNSPDSWGFDED